MASGLFAGIGGAIVKGAIGGSLGRIAFGALGSFIGNTFFGKDKNVSSEGQKISEINFQHSDYGRMIPIVYGTIKVYGNIIWASPLKELSKTTTQSMGGKGNKVRHTHTSYDYMISIAIAMCEGPITKVARIWADNRLIDRSLYDIMLHKGTEDQMPDPTIESYIGIGKTPAYRGIAYIIFKNLQLSEFGNRIPQFSFEVVRELHSISDVETAESMVTAVTMIPGGGEFVYDTVVQQKLEGDYTTQGFVQRGFRKYLNKHNMYNKANLMIALDDMQESLPSVKWVAPVVSWFATSENISEAVVVAGVEFKDNIMITPNEWFVGSKDRYSSYCIGRNNEKPRYGGTPSDSSVINMLKELRSRGLKIMLYPMMFVDVAHKPWRGRLSGNPSDVRKFFRQKDGYNEFILHYANLVKGMVDAFVIGSEMIGITKIASNNSFPAVDELINLAKQVKAILGDDIKVTYAADWSEYHHTDGGWYNLDPLWACDAIDVIGIDAYFPLTDTESCEDLIEKAIEGWDSGECYDYYYEDEARTKKASLSPEYAIKNITWWWNNKHYNPDGKETLWKPKSKKIWFTEYGFPSVHCATNQPNVFYNPESSESGFPKGSNGRVDFFSQRAGITATELRWKDSEIVENKFLWTWDARPYPEWPNCKDVWADGACWEKGHWIQGKLGVSEIGQIIADLSKRSGLYISQYKISNLSDISVHGLMLNRQNKAKDIITWLKNSFGFEISEEEGVILFGNKKSDQITEIPLEDLLHISNDKNSIVKYNSEITSIPTEISVNYINKHTNYQISNVNAKRSSENKRRKLHFDFPIVLEADQARLISENLLSTYLIESEMYTFFLSIEYCFLSIGDIIKIDGIELKIRKIVIGKNKALYIEAVRYSKAIDRASRSASKPEDINSNFSAIIPDTRLEIMDIKLLPDEQQNIGRLLFAAVGLSEGWQGVTVFININGDRKFLCSIENEGIIGTCVSNFSKPRYNNIIDRRSKVIVNLISGTLSSATDEEFGSGKNLALIGNEIIQFQKAKLIQKNQYELSHFIRGKFGSDISQELEGQRFIMLDNSIHSVPISDLLIDSEIEFKYLSNGHSQEMESDYKINYQANNLKPLSPVNISFEMDGDLLHIKWTRRSRAAIPWRSGIDMPIYEEKEMYRVRLFYRGNLLINVESEDRVIEIKISELNNLPDEIRIAQLSALTGAGIEGVMNCDLVI